MACLVSKDSNATASLRAKQVYHNKNTKNDKNTRKLVVYHAKIGCL